MLKSTVIALVAAASMVGVAAPAFAETADVLPRVENSQRAQANADETAVQTRQSTGARVLFDDASDYYRATINDSNDGTGKLL